MSRVRLIALLWLLLAPVWAYAQTTRVKGKVTDATTGKDLPFATVYFDDRHHHRRHGILFPGNGG